MTHSYAGVFLLTHAGQVVGQRRDDIPGIDNPGAVGPFGGTVERDETTRHAAWREVTKEETNLEFGPEQLELYHSDTSWRPLTGEWEDRHLYFVRIDDSLLDTLEVYEGEGWVVVSGPADPDLIPTYRDAVTRLLRVIGEGRGGAGD